MKRDLRRLVTNLTSLSYTVPAYDKWVLMDTIAFLETHMNQDTLEHLVDLAAESDAAPVMVKLVTPLDAKPILGGLYRYGVGLWRMTDHEMYTYTLLHVFEGTETKIEKQDFVAGLASGKIRQVA